ncbi:MAG: hypothetical protein ACRENN_06500 [Candidatus Eiseniibacteriota bacterium]
MSASHAVTGTTMQALKARVAPIKPPLGVQAMFGILFILGAATFIIEVRIDPTRAYAAFLIGFWYFMGLGLAGTFFTALHYLVGATWSIVVRRVAESFSSYLPIALLLLLVLLIGIPHLYVWSAPAGAEGAHAGVDLTKGHYLSTPFFTLRSVTFLVVWSLFAWYFIRNSLRQDKATAPDRKLVQSSVKASAAFILIFAITVTLAAFDFLMSLEPTWYSTIFGVYCFAGLWQSGLAALTIVVVLLRRQGALQGVVSRFHYWDLGKLMFAFSVFWVYIGFSQFMLIWYANLPEEITYMIHRTFTGWGGVGIALGTLRFVIPFFVLMPQKCKENEIVLLTVSGCILIGQWVDLYWLVLPAFSPQSVVLGWTEIGTTLGFVGLFGWWILRFLSRHPVAAVNDPLFEASLRFHE